MEHIDIRNDRGFTPLHIASRASLQDNVLLLLSYGANPNAQGPNSIDLFSLEFQLKIQLEIPY